MLSLAIFLLPLASAAASKLPDVTDRYIVTLHPSADLEAHLDHVSAFSTESHAGVTANFSLGSFQGYAAHLPRSAATSLQSHADVHTIEPDSIISVAGVPDEDCKSIDDCGGERIRYHSSTLGMISRKHVNDQLQGYAYTSSAKGTWAYVIDTGIWIRHQQFQGRAKVGYDPTHSASGQDRHGHGTWVAGLIGGSRYGAAKKANLISVKVFMDESNGIMSHALAGIEWSAKEIVKNKRAAKSVINMSWGTTTWDQVAFKRLLEECEKQGVSTVLSAGNNDVDVATTIASAPGVISVGATDRDRRRLEYSNWGSGLTIFAPGWQIESAWPDGDNGNKMSSGTSGSAALVSGLVLYLKSLHKLPDAKATTAKLLSLALPKSVEDAKGSPPLFAYNGSGK